MKQADWGGSAPYWLGAAQLEAGNSWLVGLQVSLPPLETTCSTWTYANQSGLIACKLLPPVLFLPLWTVALEWPLQGASLGKVYGDLGVPCHLNPPLSLTDVVQRRAEQYIWHQLGCRSYQKDVKVDNPIPLGATLLVFSLRFALEAFSMGWMWL